MADVSGLSPNLRGILDFELSRGNSIARVDKPAGSRCPFAVILSKPLDVSGFEKKGALPPEVRIWENRDAHYPLEKGYVCERTRHAIAGPLEP